MHKPHFILKCIPRLALDFVVELKFLYIGHILLAAFTPSDVLHCQLLPQRLVLVVLQVDEFTHLIEFELQGSRLLIFGQSFLLCSVLARLCLLKLLREFVIGITFRQHLALELDNSLLKNLVAL